MTEKIQSTLRDNAGARWTALILLSLTMFFAYMFVDVLSPIKTMLETSVKWNSTVFGAYGGSEFFLNVFVFFLIFAGIILDRMGVRFTAILSGSLMVIGAFIKVYALSSHFGDTGFASFLDSFAPAFPASAKLAMIGFAIFGCGTEMAGVTVSRAIVKWFEGKEMALAMGIEMAIARLGVFAVFQTSPLIAAKYSSVQAPVIFCTILLCIGLILILTYSIMDYRLDKQMQAQGTTGGEEPFKLQDLGKVFGRKIFWVVALLCMLYYSAIFPFQRFATEMLVSNVGLGEIQASRIFSLFPIGAMLLTPILGGFLDRRGKGATMLIIGSVLMIICHLIFAIYPFQVGSASATFIAVSAIVVLGVSFSLVPAALWPSVPKLIDNKVLGSAYSAIFWIQNIGLMSVPLLIGYVLDKTNVSVAMGAPKDYTASMLIFASFGVLALLLSLYLKALDKKNGFGLERPNIVK